VWCPERLWDSAEFPPARRSSPARRRLPNLELPSLLNHEMNKTLFRDFVKATTFKKKGYHRCPGGKMLPWNVMPVKPTGTSGHSSVPLRGQEAQGEVPVCSCLVW
jgi:hypothetical protein